MGVLMILGILLFIIIVALFILLYFRLKKYLWTIPVIVFVFGFINVFNNIISYPHHVSFIEKWNFYFSNDSSMELFVIYLPILIFSSILALLLYLLPIWGKTNSNK